MTTSLLWIFLKWIYEQKTGHVQGRHHKIFFTNYCITQSTNCMYTLSVREWPLQMYWMQWIMQVHIQGWISCMFVYIIHRYTWLFERQIKVVTHNSVCKGTRLVPSWGFGFINLLKIRSSNLNKSTKIALTCKNVKNAEVKDCRLFLENNK